MRAESLKVMPLNVGSIANNEYRSIQMSKHPAIKIHFSYYILHLYSKKREQNGEFLLKQEKKTSINGV